MSDWKWGNQFGDEDDEENEEEEGYQQWQSGQREGLIFLIDVTKPMFEKEEDDDISPFELCIKCARSVIQNKIISSEKDLLGVVFFGTTIDNNPSDFKHINILHDLDQPGAQRVLQLEDFLNEDDNNNFETQFGHSNDFSLSDALWACSNMFSSCSQKLSFKRVMLFTTNDNPHSNNAQLRRQAAAKAEDLHQNGIAVELMHMNQPGGATFSVDAFYRDVLFPDDGETLVTPDPAEKFDDLLTRVRAKDHKKRALSRLPFSLGKNLNFSVGVYNLVRRCNLPSRVLLYKNTNEEIKTVSRTYQEDTGEILMPQDMKKAQLYAGRKICFENEEIKEIKKFSDPGLVLMGFKATSSLKRYFHVKPGQFLYPDETNVEGSTTVFTSLLRKCLDRSVVAICRYVPRRNTPPRFVALIPQEEELDEHNVQLTPPGFHLLFLPFADDIRKIQLDTTLPRANEEQIDKAKELVKKLQFSFRPESFENPSLQKHYVNVEAMALDRDEPEEVIDYTMPNQTKMEKRAGRLLAEFKDLVFPADYMPGARKKAPGGAKKPRLEVEVDMEKEARAGRLDKLTVPVLKEFVKRSRIHSSSQRKADLIDAISNHFGV